MKKDHLLEAFARGLFARLKIGGSDEEETCSYIKENVKNQLLASSQEPHHRRDAQWVTPERLYL